MAPMSDNPMTSEVSGEELMGFLDSDIGAVLPTYREQMREKIRAILSDYARLKAENERLNAMIEVDDQERTLIIARAEKAEAELAELRAFKVTALGILEKYGETLATGKALAVLLRAALAARTK